MATIATTIAVMMAIACELPSMMASIAIIDGTRTRGPLCFTDAAWAGFSLSH